MLDDIEDLGKTVDSEVQRLPPTMVAPKRGRTRRGGDEKGSTTTGGSAVPGTQKIWIKTWGCSHNNSDGEYMAGQLASYGYTITNDRKAADLWLLNSCTVKNPSQDTFINAIRAGKSQDKHVVLAGCVSQAQPDHKEFVPYSMIGVQQIDRVVEVVEETLKGNSVQMLAQKNDGGARLHLPKIRRNPLVEIIPINTGCLNQCTYCKTKQARGDLRSYLPEEIVQRVKAVLEEGVVEIWLTSEDLGTYGRDIGTSLPELLWKIVAVLPEGTRLRCGMTNPPYILEHLEEMAKIFNHPRVYAFLHVPVQAGSDKVLHDMRRQYTNEDFCRVVDFLRERVPGIHLATDVICGFPTETEDDFQQTMDLIEKYKFPAVNISQFYPRPGTPAARMKRLSTKVVKQRSTRMTKLFNNYTYFTADLVGTRHRVLTTQVAHDKVHFVAHNKNYDQVLVPMEQALLGKMFDVEIIAVTKFALKARVVRETVDTVPIHASALPRGAVSQTHVHSEAKDTDFDYAAAKKAFKLRRRKEKQAAVASAAGSRATATAETSSSDDKTERTLSVATQSRQQHYAVKALMAVVLLFLLGWLVSSRARL